MSPTESVIRFCPRCGGKAKANAERFATPQVCPACKVPVLFWDVTKEPVDQRLEASLIKPLISKKSLQTLLAIAIGIAILVLLLLAVGFVALPSTLAALFLVVGGYCIAIFFAQQYNLGVQTDQITSLFAVVESSRDQQGSLGLKFTALKENFESLVDHATKSAVESKAAFDSMSVSLENEYQLKVKTIERDSEAVASNAVLQAQRREDEARSTVRTIAVKYIAETQKLLIAKLNPENLTQTQDRFLKCVEFCAKVGFELPATEIHQFQEEIKREYAVAVRKQLARDEQARIKEKLREEAKAEAEFNREMKRLEQEEKLLERLLAEARSKATAESTAQIEDLERRLAEAKEKERALSMAQQTKAGNVYVISNLGSFGENVFKIGMTRRLEPMDRVKELGDASVPFPFDVHMMIACENAPYLENELHKRFNSRRINKVNFRKEFFSVSIQEISEAVDALHGQVDYLVDPEALEFRESCVMTDEQFELVTEISKQAGLEDQDDDQD